MSFRMDCFAMRTTRTIALRAAKLDLKHKEATAVRTFLIAVT
jgi:hypothetical protein